MRIKYEYNYYQSSFDFFQSGTINKNPPVFSGVEHRGWCRRFDAVIEELFQTTRDPNEGPKD